MYSNVILFGDNGLGICVRWVQWMWYLPIYKTGDSGFTTRQFIGDSGFAT